MLGPKTDGPKLALTVSGPAAVMWPKSPPRSSAPGPLAVVLAPERHILSSLKPPHPGHSVEGAARRDAVAARARRRDREGAEGVAVRRTVVRSRVRRPVGSHLPLGAR